MQDWLAIAVADEDSGRARHTKGIAEFTIHVDLPGIGTMANYGGVRYTNVVFAEDEANLPSGWATHATERHAYASGQSSISLAFAACGK